MFYEVVTCSLPLTQKWRTLWLPFCRVADLICVVCVQGGFVVVSHLTVFLPPCFAHARNNVLDFARSLAN